MGLVGYNQAPYKCRGDGSKCVDSFSRLVDVKDKVGEGANLCPEHLDDPQKTLCPGGVRVAVILIPVWL